MREQVNHKQKFQADDRDERIPSYCFFFSNENENKQSTQKYCNEERKKEIKKRQTEKCEIVDRFVSISNGSTKRLNKQFNCFFLCRAKRRSNESMGLA